MKKFNKLVAMLTLAATISTSFGALNANECCAYEECRRAPLISPTLALGTIAVAAVIAVVVSNRKHGGHHSGSSSSTSVSAHAHSHGHS